MLVGETRLKLRGEAFLSQLLLRWRRAKKGSSSGFLDILGDLDLLDASREHRLRVVEEVPLTHS